MTVEQDDQIFQLLLDARDLANQSELEQSANSIQTVLNMSSLELRERAREGRSRNKTASQPTVPKTIFALKFHSHNRYCAVERTD